MKTMILSMSLLISVSAFSAQRGCNGFIYTGTEARGTTLHEYQIVLDDSVQMTTAKTIDNQFEIQAIAKSADYTDYSDPMFRGFGVSKFVKITATRILTGKRFAELMTIKPDMQTPMFGNIGTLDIVCKKESL